MLTPAKAIVIAVAVGMSFYVVFGAVMYWLLGWPSGMIMAVVIIGGGSIITALRVRDMLAGRPKCAGC